MTSENIRRELARAARRAWPGTGKASDLPFPAYWKGAVEWLCFHAPHVGDRLMGEFIAEIVREAVAAGKNGCEPKPITVPEEVREIWQQGRGMRDEGAWRRGQACGGVDGSRRHGRPQGWIGDAWEHAAERAQAVRDRFGRRQKQGTLL